MNLLIRKVQTKILQFKSNILKHNKEFVPFSDIKEAIIFFNSESLSESHIIKYYRILSSYGINTKMICYSQCIDIAKIDMRVLYINDNDISLYGNFKDSTISENLNKQYDVLFDLRNSSNVRSRYIQKIIRSKFLVACSNDLDDIDILIDTKGELEKFVDNSIEFLMKIAKP